MAVIVGQIRSIYYRALIALLFPLVFAVTYIDHIAPDWREGFVIGVKFSVVFSAFSSLALLGVLAVGAMV